MLVHQPGPQGQPSGADRPSPDGQWQFVRRIHRPTDRQEGLFIYRRR
jgi:hypothetical protein